MISDPDGERLAIASNDGRLLLLDTGEGEAELLEPDAEAPEAGEKAPSGSTRADLHTATGAAAPDSAAPIDEHPGLTELIRSVNGPVRDLAFSPDGDWLTWSHPGIGRSLRQIKLARISGPAAPVIVDVTNGRFEDENPVFTEDGRYLAFLSWRGFDPVYDVHTGDLSFPLGCRPYLVPLSSATPSPFALSPDGRPAAGGLDPVDVPEGGTGEGSTVMVEFEGLESRVTPFPVSASKYSALAPVSGGGLVWLRWPISGALGETFANPADMSGRPTLEHFNIAKARRTELVDHLDWFAVSGDASRIVVMDDGELRAVPAAEPGDTDSTVYLDLRRILHEVDPGAEWRQAYGEAGRIIRSYFWEPDMCGIDWAGVLDQYRPWSNGSRRPTSSRTCCARCWASWAPRTRTSPPPAATRARRTTSARSASSAPTWSAGTAPGPSSASCPATPRTPRPVRRWRVRVSGRARSSPMSTAARWTRSPAPTPC